MRRSIVLAKSLANQEFEREERLSPLSAGSRDRDFCTWTGREHHKAHDRRSANADAVLLDPNLGLKTTDQLHELGRCASMQSALVYNFKLTDQLHRH